MGQKDESKVRAVQFHPNLSYEDFVRGWRPTGEGKLSLADGVFMEAIKAASKDPSSKFVVVIEEIIVFGNDGRALSPFHTTKKNGRRYRYYVPQRENKEHAGASGLPRLPAAELESAVLDQLRAVLRSPDLLGDILPRAIELDPSLDEAKVTVAMTRLDTIWDQLFPAEQTRIVKLLVEKVIVSPNDLEVRLRANGIERLVLELQPTGTAQPEEALA